MIKGEAPGRRIWEADFLVVTELVSLKTGRSSLAIVLVLNVLSLAGDAHGTSPYNTVY